MFRYVQDGQRMTDCSLATSLLFKGRRFPYSERDNPDVVEEGRTTEISSVSIADIVEMDQRA